MSCNSLGESEYRVVKIVNVTRFTICVLSGFPLYCCSQLIRLAYC